jgi:hypothetical protein
LRKKAMQERTHAVMFCRGNMGLQTLLQLVSLAEAHRTPVDRAGVKRFSCCENRLLDGIIMY